MKKILHLLICLISSLSVSYAAFDEFNRVDTAVQTPASSPNLIGAHWTIPVGDWAINSGQLKQPVGPGGQQFIYLNTLQTLNSGVGTNFTIQATVQLNTPVTDESTWAGIFFNYQDANNFCVLRYAGSGNLQLLKSVGGGLVGFGIMAVSFTPVQNRPYTLTVTSLGPDNFAVSVYDTVAATTVYSNSGIPLGGASLTDGYGGLYDSANPGDAAYDNFSLTVTPAQPVAPSVVVQPVDTTGVPCDSLTLSALIDGNPAPQVQWKFNGVNIPGATTQSLTLGNLQPANVGSYALYATNASGSVNTTTATVSVLTGGGVDGFSRANTGPQTQSSSPNQIGANWTIANGTWAIKSRKLVQDNGSVGGNQVIYWNTLNTLNSGTGTNFTLQATVRLNTPVADGTVWAGLLFNFQDDANFCVMRYSGAYVQVLKFVGGNLEYPIQNVAVAKVQDRPYTLTVASQGENNYSVGMYDTVTGATLFTNANFALGVTPITNGYAGLFCGVNIAYASYDNFSLKVVPAQPAPLTVLADPADSAGLPGSSLTLSAFIDGNPAPQLQWKFNGVDIPNATDQTLTLNNLEAANVGSYALYGTNASGWINTAAAAVAMHVRGRDIFNRADTSQQTPASSPNEIGWQWTVANGTWAITDGHLVQAGGPSVADQVIYWNTLQTSNSAPGVNFTAQATVQWNAPITDNTSFAGLAFNIQDASNYYVLRYSGNGYVQLLSIVGGGIFGVFINQPGFAPVQNRPYTLSVTSAGAYAFNVSVYDTVTGTTVYDGSAVDLAESFTDGYAGLYESAHFPLLACSAFNVYVSPATFAPNYNHLSVPILAGGAVELNLPATPGNTYVLDRAISLSAPAWQPVATNTVNLNGLANFTNAAAAAQGYFRAWQP